DWARRRARAPGPGRRSSLRRAPPRRSAGRARGDRAGRHRALAMIELGRLALGTAPIGGLYEAVEDEAAHAVVERAWALGLRYFDTPPLSGAGLAEPRPGAALAGQP